jgi:hypothetical protein
VRRPAFAVVRVPAEAKLLLHIIGTNEIRDPKNASYFQTHQSWYYKAEEYLNSSAAAGVQIRGFING